MNAIFSTLLYEMEKRRDAVLCTIVRADGSTPRGAGAQMLAGEDGLLTGTIGGGAIEAGALQLSKALLAEKRSAVREYQLHQGGEADIGMVCGGNATVLLQYIAASDAAWQALAGEALHRIALRQPGYLVLSADGAPRLCELPAAADGVFSVPLPIGERVLLFGAGHCSVALAPLLATVGFRVTVLDNRPELLTEQRFPDAEALLPIDFEKITEYVTIDEDDYVVVMTSGHSFDFAVQAQILRGRCAYMGVIGSRRKTAAVNARLREAGIDEKAIQSVHTPIGIAIKAVTPEEIAVSVAAEMILERALRRERAGVALHGCPMHAPGERL